MDAQITVAETAALTALVQCIARLETLEGYASPELVDPTEVLAENRFIAARDGMQGAHIDPVRARIPVTALLDRCSSGAGRTHRTWAARTSWSGSRGWPRRRAPGAS